LKLDKEDEEFILAQTSAGGGGLYHWKDMPSFGDAND